MLFERLYARIAPEVSLDLGTVNTPVYVRGHGVRFVEPTLVAIDTDSGAVVTIGEGARQMLGRTPRSITVVRPMRNGVVSDYRYAEVLIARLLERALRGKPLVPARVVVGVPGSATEVEKKAIREAARAAGAGRVYFVPQALAAAVGAGLPVLEARGSMIVDIGGGTTEAAVLSLGGMVSARSLKVGGDQLDEAIIAHLRTTRNFHIGERTAESLKIELGYYGRPQGKPPVRVMGQDARQLLPGTIEVREEEVAAAIAEPLGMIVDAVRSLLEQTPPELVRDLGEHGIVIAGGGALIAGLAQTLADVTGIPVRTAEQPLLCVALGAAQVLREPRLFAALFPAPQSVFDRWWRSFRFGMRENSSSSSR